MILQDIRRPEINTLPIILLVDCSGSMDGEKMDVTNKAVDTMLKAFKNHKSSQAELQVAIITFGDTAELAYDLQSTQKICFEDLEAGGLTPLGGALEIARDLIMDKTKITSKSYRPIIGLISDGQPNDNYKDIFREFISEGRSSKSERIALGIGEDADLKLLGQFSNIEGNRVFQADTAADIIQFFNYLTITSITRGSSKNPSATPSREELRATSKIMGVSIDDLLDM